MTTSTAKPAPTKQAAQQRTLKDMLLANVRSYGIFLALVVVILVFQGLTGGRLLTPNNVVALFQQNAYVMITAIGMLMVIIATDIDLSVGSVIAFVGGVGAIAMRDWGMNWFLAVIIMLVIGLLIGAFQGFWVAYVGVPGFVTTLGGMLLFRGLATVIAGESIPVSDNTFRSIASAYLPNILGFWGNLDGLTIVVGVVCIAAYIVMQFRNRSKALKNGLQAELMSYVVLKCVLVALLGGYFTVLLSQSGNETSGGIPVSLLIIVVLIAVYWFVLNRTVYGRNVYAIGGNRRAAILSGIDTRRTEFCIFLNMGFLEGVASVITLSRLASATAQTGQSFEMDAIAACFIGGTAVTGGIGTIPGAMVGALIMGVLNQGLSIMGVNAAWVSVIKGLVVILAVAYDILSKRSKH